MLFRTLSVPPILDPLIDHHTFKYKIHLNGVTLQIGIDLQSKY